MFDHEAPAETFQPLLLPTDQLPSLGDFTHPVQAYLNAAPSSRRPQLSALEWIARRSTQVFTAPGSGCAAPMCLRSSYGRSRRGRAGARMRAHQELPESKNGLDQFVDQLVSGVLEEGEQDWIAPLRN